MDPVAILSPVSIKDVTASLCEDKKSGRRWLAFSFALVFSLEDKAARNFVLDRFGQSLCWSFDSVQRELEGLARMKESAARLAESGGEHGSVTLSAPGMEAVTLTSEDARRLRREANDIRKGRAH